VRPLVAQGNHPGNTSHCRQPAQYRRLVPKSIAIVVDALVPCDLDRNRF
jgi:hypothetical protein